MGDLEAMASTAIDCGFQIHKELGPGLLESVYEILLANAISDRGLRVERQRPVPIAYRGVALVEAFRADLVVEGRLVLEIKSVERTAPVHTKQLLTFLRLMDQPLGLLMNFGFATFREGLKRVVNGYNALAP